MATRHPPPLDAFERLDTCAVSDALDRLRLGGATVGITRLAGASRTVAGWAVTTRVSGTPPATGPKVPHLGTMAVERSGPTDVIVVDAGGRGDVSAWGGILSGTARARGVRGVVVDGACRDVQAARSLGFQVFARAVVPVSARGRIWHESVQEPVSCGGVVVAAGDLVVADANGVVFVARDRVEEVARLAARIAAEEERMLERARRGEPLSAVMVDPAPAGRRPR